MTRCIGFDPNGSTQVGWRLLRWRCRLSCRSDTCTSTELHPRRPPQRSPTRRYRILRLPLRSILPTTPTTVARLASRSIWLRRGLCRTHHICRRRSFRSRSNILVTSLLSLSLRSEQLFNRARLRSAELQVLADRTSCRQLRLWRSDRARQFHNSLICRTARPANAVGHRHRINNSPPERQGESL